VENGHPRLLAAIAQTRSVSGFKSPYESSPSKEPRATETIQFPFQMGLVQLRTARTHVQFTTVLSIARECRWLGSVEVFVETRVVPTYAP
jgi:hypothetical protein